NDPSIGFPINGTGGRDGLATGVPVGVTFVGINNTGNGDLGVFDGTSQVGGLFTTNNGSIAALGGATGLDTTNIVLVGQFTTNGIFQYELNVQIGTPAGGTQNFVSSNPVGTEILASFLTGTLGAPNAAPTVSITAPANGSSFITGSNVSITANASDADGTVSQVEFFVDGVSIGVDNTAPYTASYTAVAGTRSITARATDDQGAQTTSSAVSITVAANPPPTCSITSPANGASFVVGDAVSIAATATDNGFVTQVDFFVDGILLSTDVTAPYTATYTAALGSHTITARATDNASLTTTSSAVTISVVNNVPPTVSITSPANGANFTFPASVTINATASDADGSVSSVGFYVNGSLVGTDNTSPYSFTWTSVIGTASLTAIATDNRGATTTSSAVIVNIIDPNALPYKISRISSPCRDTSFCIPISAVDTINNVIGYDLVLNFNTSKVRPTGVVTVFGDLITPSFVDVANSIDTVAGTMNISLFFNSTAPANAKFAGSGRLVCVEFAKRTTFSFIDTANVTLPFLQESYFNGVATRLVEAGRYTSFKDSLFSGSLKFWADNSPIRYNAANPNQFLQTSIFGNNASCNGQTVYNVSPDTLGNFNFVISNGSQLTINKNILGTTSVQPVVNGFDAFLLRRMLLSDPTFVPNVFQAIAMDVNLDGVISAGDLSQVNQRAVLFIPEFRQAWNYNASGVSNGQPSKDWIFVDSSTTLTGAAYQISSTFPNDNGVGFSKSRVPVVPFCLPFNVSNLATCPDIRPDVFRAIMTGDVNGSYSVTNPNNQFRLSGDARVIVDAAKVKRSGNYLEVPVSFTGTADVHAIDLAIGYGSSS
ncbi:MAG: Ig-like domain-containing protein, partial [Bacteroidota bacterium]